MIEDSPRGQNDQKNSNTASTHDPREPRSHEPRRNPESGVSRAAFAAHLGAPLQRINELVRGKRGVTPETASLLSQALHTTPEFWINLQTAHDLVRSRPTQPVQRLAAVKRAADFADKEVDRGDRGQASTLGCRYRKQIIVRGAFSLDPEPRPC